MESDLFVSDWTCFENKNSFQLGQNIQKTSLICVLSLKGEGEYVAVLIQIASTSCSHWVYL